LLISLSGFSLGIAAITGLISTSAKPLDAENITVPRTSPKYTDDGKITGARAKSPRPARVRTGIILTARGILNLWEKNENIRSTVSWVTKLIRTKRPRRVYEIPYKERNVRKRIGERLPTMDIDTLAE
jgi:hypothetical protein